MAKIESPTVTPCISYLDAPAAIEWLCRAFGFEKQLIVEGDKPGVIQHSQLTCGNGMIMVSSADKDAAWQKSPRTLGGTTATMSIYVADADAHHMRAVAAGAEVILPLEDKPYGGRGYGCRDLEGHIWFFGTYNPWAK